MRLLILYLLYNFLFLYLKGQHLLFLVPFLFRRTQWFSEPNVIRLQKVTWKMLDRNGDAAVTLDEFLLMAPKLRFTEEQATRVFAEVDTDGKGGIDEAEFDKAFKDERVTYEKARWHEKVLALVHHPRRSAGEYRPIDPEDTCMDDDPWIALFPDYLPFHIHFLAIGLAFTVVEAFVLGAMEGLAQASMLTALSFVMMAAVLWSPPSTLLAQTRMDTIDALGAFLTYGLHLATMREWLSPSGGAQSMLFVSGFLVVHGFMTLLDPLLEDCPNIIMCLCLTCMFWRKKKSADDGDEAVDDLSALPVGASPHRILSNGKASFDSEAPPEYSRKLSNGSINGGTASISRSQSSTVSTNVTGEHLEKEAMAEFIESNRRRPSAEELFLTAGNIYQSMPEAQAQSQSSLTDIEPASDAPVPRRSKGTTASPGRVPSKSGVSHPPISRKPSADIPLWKEAPVLSRQGSHSSRIEEV